MKILKIDSLIFANNLSKDEMKNVNGGEINGNGCSASVTCSVVYDAYCEISGAGSICHGEEGVGVYCFNNDDHQFVYCPI